MYWHVEPKQRAMVLKNHIEASGVNTFFLLISQLMVSLVLWEGICKLYISHSSSKMSY